MKWLLPAAAILAEIILTPGIVLAETSDNVNATVKIGVCGNGIVESPEECEGVNLNSQTCVGLGYASGSLSCDSACTFVVTACAPKPTPSPSPAASSATTVTAATTTAAAITPLATVIEAIKKIFSPLVPILPQKIKSFDTDKDGSLSFEELKVSVREWITSWQQDVAFRVSEFNKNQSGAGNQPPDLAVLQKCDINQDKICDLVDLSVILYFGK